MTKYLAFIFTLVSFSSYAQAPNVVGVLPTPGTVGVDPDTEIVVDFDVPVNPATINSSSFKVFGKWSGPASGTFSFENSDQRVRFTPDEHFFVTEGMIVNLSKAIQSAGGAGMTQGYAWDVRIGSSVTEMPVLEYVEMYTLDLRLPGEGSIVSYGAYAGDLNNDGFSDLSVPNELAIDVRVLMNDNGAYSDFEAFDLPGGSLPSPNDGGDFNEDGEIDLAVGSAGNDQLSIMLGDGTGSFPTITSKTASGSGVRGVVVMDANGDGHDDIVTASRVTGTLDFFEGNGDGTFEDRVTFDAGGTGETAIAAADANGDGLLDLFVGALNSGEVMIMLSNGDGTFTLTETFDTPGGSWMMGAGDFNGDGNADAVTSGAAANLIAVLFGDGTGQFSDMDTYQSGSFTIAIDVGDLDNDDDLDFISSNYSSGDFVVYENDGTGQFSIAQTLKVSGAGSCAIIQDADNDGFVDVVGVDEVEDQLLFYELVHVVSSGTEGPSSSAQNLYIRTNPVRSHGELELSVDAPQHVRLSIYDMLGREVATLLNGSVSARVRRVHFDTESLPSGAYLIVLDTNNGRTTEKITIVR